MRRFPISIFALMLILIGSACRSTTASSDAETLPQERPSDFTVRLVDQKTGINRDIYSISAKSASFTIQSSERPRTWEFVPQAAKLDSLYAQMRSSNLWGIDMVAETAPHGDDPETDLVINAGGRTLSLKDGREYFIDKEVDYNRFRDFNAEVRAFVGAGIADQRHEFRAHLVLERGAPVPDSLYVRLEAAELVRLTGQDKPGDTLWGSFTGLSGRYQVLGRAVVDGKVYEYEKAIDLKQPTDLWLGMNKQGFVEH